MVSLYKSLNNVQTHLITWNNPFNCNGQDVIVCVTGNPGVPDFYIDFGSELHKNTGLPVCIIGQAGHEEVSDEKSNELKNQEHLFNLDGQLKHKLDLICNNIDKSSKLHLIGHSIGAWLILELLHRNRDLTEKVVSINLLFPTLQKMAETKNGRHINNILRRLHALVMLFFILIDMLPMWLRLFMAKTYLKFKQFPIGFAEGLLKYLKPRALEKILFLAYEEMDKVTTLNTKAIENVKHLTNVIYSTRDDWAPLDLMEDLKKFQPQLQMKKVNIGHAFVLKSSEKVAEMVSEFIHDKKQIVNK